ncbi:hypothetical protein YC2023_040955 [Brassica napus]
MIGGERRLIGGFTPTATELSRGGSAIIKRALLDGAGALLDGTGALLDGDEAVSRWRRSSLTVALLESQTGCVDPRNKKKEPQSSGLQSRAIQYQVLSRPRVVLSCQDLVL